MLSLFFRNLFFTLLQPGIVAGLIPYWIVKNNIILNNPLQVNQYLGMIVFFIGLIILFYCIISFAVEGRGTLSPADPTKRLVVKGLYRFSRNPMYVGVMMILVGEAVFFQSTGLWMYSLLICLAFCVFIIFFEEPRLRKDFGEEYINYCQQVRRWLLWCTLL